MEKNKIIITILLLIIAILSIDKIYYVVDPGSDTDISAMNSSDTSEFDPNTYGTYELNMTPKVTIDCDGIISYFMNESYQIQNIIEVPLIFDCLDWQRNPPNSEDLKLINFCVIIDEIKYGRCV